MVKLIITHMGDFLENQGADWETYSPCCSFATPTTWDKFKIYRTENACGSVYCYTNNVIQAEAWPQCIQDAAGAKIEELREINSSSANATGGISKEMYEGVCEYIDYETLRKGLIENGAMPYCHRWSEASWGKLLGSLVIVSTVHSLLYVWAVLVTPKRQK